jgi:hypothetical protein
MKRVYLKVVFCNSLLKLEFSFLEYVVFELLPSK